MRFHRRTASAARPLVESLESRTLCTAVLAIVADPVPVHLATTATPIVATVSGLPINAATITGARAFVRWDNRLLVKAKVVASSDHFAIVPLAGPTTEGNHTFSVSFWETTPGGVVFDTRLRSGTATVDHNSNGGASFVATANTAFQGTVGLLTLALPDSADGQTSPISTTVLGVPTTLTVTINWGDDTSSAGTLTKSTSTHWLVSGTHTYTTGGTFRVQIRAFTPSTDLQAIISTATVSSPPV